MFEVVCSSHLLCIRMLLWQLLKWLWCIYSEYYNVRVIAGKLSLKLPVVEIFITILCIEVLLWQL